MTTFCAFVRGAAMLLLAGSWGASGQDALFSSERDCTADVLSLCTRVMPAVDTAVCTCT
jgi:hypothetical protein